MSKILFRSLVFCLFLILSTAYLNSSPTSRRPASSSTDTDRAFSSLAVELIPLDILGAGLYQGHQGGLYPGGKNVPPKAHKTKISQASNRVKKILGTKVFLSIGASNTATEFETFMSYYSLRLDKNPSLALVNGCRGSESLEDMLIDDYLVTYVQSQLSASGVTPDDVNVIWFKSSSLSSKIYDLSFLDYVDYEKNLLVDLVELLKLKFPNLELIYFSGRHTTKFLTDNNGTKYTQHFEPRAMYNQFSIKDLIEAQINNDPRLSYDISPVLAWANPFFTDGVTPNSFGHTWTILDVNNSLLHPSDAGKAKTATYLMNFFSTNPYTMRWFLN